MDLSLLRSPAVCNLKDHCGFNGYGLYIDIYIRFCELEVKQMPFDELLGYLGPNARRGVLKLLIVKNPRLLSMDEDGLVCLAQQSLAYACDAPRDDAPAPIPAPVSAGVPSFTIEDNKEKEDYHLPKRDSLKVWIDGITLDSEWTNLALMRVPFRKLVMSHWEETKEQFRQHVIVNCTSHSICNEDDAKRYFFYYLTNAASGKALQVCLEQLEKQNGRNPYEFEDPGSNSTCRLFQGMRLPLSAPPRPNYFAMWNEMTNEWES